MATLIIATLITFALLAAYAVVRAWRSVSPHPPSSYTCRSGVVVEGDLDLDDGRPTDPGEELTVVSEPEWVEDTLVSAADELGRVTGPDRGGSS